MLLLLQVSQTGSAAGANTSEGRRESVRLKVFLAPRGGEIHVQQIPARPQGATSLSGRPDREMLTRGPSGGLSAVLPDKEPELASEIDSGIDDPRVRGFMILHLQIDEAGAVGMADVVYSELPSSVADLLAKRFALASFKPAVRNGKVVEASILLRIDID